VKSNEIDKIIADAVNESKCESKWHRPSKGNSTSILTARRVLNTLFMVGFILTIIIYFVFPENKILFFSFGFGSMILKIIEFYLRFMF